MTGWVVTGSRRGVLSPQSFWERLNNCTHVLGRPNIVFVGDATGVDTDTIYWCLHMNITLRIFCASPDRWRLWRNRAWAVLAADWALDNAGPIRNRLMLQCATPAALVLAFPDAQSRGTHHCIRTAKELGHRVYFPLEEMRS